MTRKGSFANAVPEFSLSIAENALQLMSSEA